MNKKDCNICEKKKLPQPINADFDNLVLFSTQSIQRTQDTQRTLNADRQRTLNSNKLGNSTWLFLHTTAAYYPEYPTNIQKQKMLALIDSISEFYPCHICVEHLKEYIKKNPPTVNSNIELSQWFCKLHNDINLRNNKPIFNCSKILANYY